VSLIVGIRCTDSLVLAASGPGNLPSEDGIPPARQRAKKLRLVGGQAILGVSGYDGLAQDMALSLEMSLAELELRETAEEDLRGNVRDALAAPIQRTIAIHRSLKGIPGLGSAIADYALSQSMVAIPSSSSFRLFVLDPECSLTEITDELLSVAIGNSRAVAEPFLTFLRKVLWNDGLPGRAEGELAAYWTVRNAIDSNPTGLSLPIQLVVMAKGDDGSIEISERGESEIAGISLEMEDRLEAIRRSFGDMPPSAAGGSGNSTPRGAAQPVKKRVPEVRLTLDSAEKRQRNWRW
jgi:hypothetical protein